jgi:hypothetical protein
MVDCGLAQGFIKNQHDVNYDDFKYNPNDIAVLIVTHAHIDHIGRIPKLIKDGFRGRIISTKPTQEIVPLMFEDALNVINDNARKKDIKPLYGKEDVEKVLNLWHSIDYHENLNGSLYVARNFETSEISGIQKTISFFAIFIIGFIYSLSNTLKIGMVYSKYDYEKLSRLKLIFFVPIFLIINMLSSFLKFITSNPNVSSYSLQFFLFINLLL